MKDRKLPGMIFLIALSVCIAGGFAINGIDVHGNGLLALVIIVGISGYTSFMALLDFLFPRAIYAGETNFGYLLLNLLFLRWFDR